MFPLVEKIEIFPDGRLEITDEKGTRTYSWQAIEILGISEVLKGKTKDDIINKLKETKERLENAKALGHLEAIIHLEGYISALKWVLED